MTEIALLQQKVEFLELQLTESQKRQESQRQLNDSLMKAVGAQNSSVLEVSTIKGQTVSELEKCKRQLEAQLQTLKTRTKQVQTQNEKRIDELTIANKELRLEISQQRLTSQTQRHDLLLKNKNLENSVERMQQTIQQAEEDKNHALKVVEFQMTLKMMENSQSVEVLKQKQTMELEKARAQADAAIKELTILFENQKNNLKEQNRSLQMKLKIRKIEGNEEIEDFQMPLKGTQSDLVNFMLERVQQKEKIIEAAQRTNTKLNQDLEEAKAQIQRLEIELDKSLLELKQYKLDRVETPNQDKPVLKGEIKQLIGRLLNAKKKPEFLSPPRQASNSSRRSQNSNSTFSLSVKDLC